jgi:hypothetical protein
VRLGIGEDAHLALLVDECVVLSDLLGATVSDEITSGVSDVGDDGLIVAHGACDESGAHAFAAVLGGEGAVVDSGVGLLDEAGQEADEHGAWRGLFEAFYKDLHGLIGGDLAKVGSTDTVSDSEEIAVGSGLLTRCWNEEAEGVFIVGANLAWIGCLAELDFQHGRCRL